MPITDTASTNAGTVIPEIWAMKTIDDREANLVMPNLMDRDYEAELNKYGGAGDTVRMHGVQNFGAANTKTITVEQAALTITEGAFNVVSGGLVIDTHAYMQFELDYVFEFQTHIPMFEKLAHKAGYAVALKIDDDCAGLPDDFSQTVGTLAVPLTDDDVRSALRQLRTANVPDSPIYLFCSENQQLEFYNIDKYVNNLYKPAVGNLDTKKSRGYFGSMYGVDWYMSTNVEGTVAAGFDNGMWHRDAIAIVIQDDMRSTVEYDITADATKFIVHAVYGIKEIRDNHGVWMKGA